jgi:hypothetical protein
MVYRQHPSVGIVLVGIGGLTLALTPLPFLTVEAESESARWCASLFCVALGLAFGAFGYSTFRECVVVDLQGVHVKALWISQAFAWEELTHWNVETEKEDNLKRRRARFYVNNTQVPVDVWEWETFPGFDSFLVEVRRHAGRKEQAAAHSS